MSRDRRPKGKTEDEMKKRDPINEKALNDYAEKVEAEGKSAYFLEGSSPPLVISDKTDDSPKFETVYTFQKAFTNRGVLRYQGKQKLKEDFARGVSIVTIIDIHPTKGIDRTRSYNQQGLV